MERFLIFMALIVQIKNFKSIKNFFSRKILIVANNDLDLEKNVDH